MKNITIKNDEGLEEFAFAEVNDVDALFEAFDEQLKKFGLELVLGGRGDTCYWVKVVKTLDLFEAFVQRFQKVIGRELTETQRKQLLKAYKQ